MPVKSTADEKELDHKLLQWGLTCQQLFQSVHGYIKSSWALYVTMSHCWLYFYICLLIQFWDLCRANMLGNISPTRKGMYVNIGDANIMGRINSRWKNLLSPKFSSCAMAKSIHIHIFEHLRSRESWIQMNLLKYFKYFNILHIQSALSPVWKGKSCKFVCAVDFAFTQQSPPPSSQPLILEGEN